MQLVQQGISGLSLLWRVNADRLLSIGTVALSLLAGAFLCGALFGQY